MLSTQERSGSGRQVGLATHLNLEHLSAQM